MAMSAEVTVLIAADPFQRLVELLDCVESGLRMASSSVASLGLGPKIDVCLVQHLGEAVSDLRPELRAIKMKSCQCLRMNLA